MTPKEKILAEIELLKKDPPSYGRRVLMRRLFIRLAKADDPFGDPEVLTRLKRQVDAAQCLPLVPVTQSGWVLPNGAFQIGDFIIYDSKSPHA